MFTVKFPLILSLINSVILFLHLNDRCWNLVSSNWFKLPVCSSVAFQRSVSIPSSISCGLFSPTSHLGLGVWDLVSVCSKTQERGRRIILDLQNVVTSVAFLKILPLSRSCSRARSCSASREQVTVSENQGFFLHPSSAFLPLLLPLFKSLSDWELLV